MDTMTISHNSSVEGAGRKYIASKKEETPFFFKPNFCMPKMLRFLWRFQICMKNMKNFCPSPYPHPAGFLMCHSSLVTGGGEGGLGGGGAMSYTGACA